MKRPPVSFDEVRAVAYMIDDGGVFIQPVKNLNYVNLSKQQSFKGPRYHLAKVTINIEWLDEELEEANRETAKYGDVVQIFGSGFNWRVTGVDEGKYWLKNTKTGDTTEAYLGNITKIIERA